MNTQTLIFFMRLIYFTLSHTHFLCDDITSLNFNFNQYNTLMVITQHFKGSQISTKKGKLNSFALRKNSARLSFFHFSAVVTELMKLPDQEEQAR